MKRWQPVLISIVMLIMGANCFAVEVEGDAYVGVYSKYLSNGFDSSDGEPVLQAGVDLSAHGVTVGYWSNFQLQDGDSPEMEAGEVTETDISIDYTVDLTDNILFSIGDTHCTYNVPGYDNEIYIGFAFDVLLSPEFITYYNWGGLDRLYYTLGVSHDFEPKEDVTLGLGALVIYNQQTYALGDYSAFNNIELSAFAEYALTDNWAFSGDLLYSGPLSTGARNAGVADEVVGGLNVIFAF